MAGSSSAKARAKRRTIVVTMIKASLVGLIVPLLVVALSMLAAFLLKELNILIRATLMVLFGLAGLGLGTYVTLRILEEKVQPSLYSEEGENLRTPTRRAKRLRRGN